MCRDSTVSNQSFVQPPPSRTHASIGPIAPPPVRRAALASPSTVAWLLYTRVEARGARPKISRLRLQRRRALELGGDGADVGGRRGGELGLLRRRARACRGGSPTRPTPARRAPRATARRRRQQLGAQLGALARSARRAHQLPCLRRALEPFPHGVRPPAAAASTAAAVVAVASAAAIDDAAEAAHLLPTRGALRAECCTAPRSSAADGPRAEPRAVVVVPPPPPPPRRRRPPLPSGRRRGHRGRRNRAPTRQPRRRAPPPPPAARRRRWLSRAPPPAWRTRHSARRARGAARRWRTRAK